MTNPQQLSEQIQQRFENKISATYIAFNELTVELPAAHLREVCWSLKEEQSFQFDALMDVCGVDYLCYGVSEWMTESTTFTGFSRAVDRGGVTNSLTPTSLPEETSTSCTSKWQKPRFAVVYHLLSIPYNRRIRLRAFPEGDPPTIESVVNIWASANWFEREAFDLFGIMFKGHPDLRRILTDYGFIGHPFRKDFPLIGQVEMRYDGALQRCVYEPVSIQPRTLVPKVIRDDNRGENV